jgi:ankyrin repeat protein
MLSRIVIILAVVMIGALRVYMAAPACAQALSNGAYTLSPASDSSIYLTDKDAGSADGTTVMTTDRTGDPDQIWIIELATDGYYRVRPSCSGHLALEVYRSEGYDGAIVSLYASAELANQLWQVKPEPFGYFMLIPKCQPNMALGIEIYNRPSIAMLVQQSRKPSQLWRIEPVGSTDRPLDARANSALAAAKTGDVAAIQALLPSGFPVDEPLDADDDTMLMEAMSANQTEAERVLLASGADIDSMNASGLTPAHYLLGLSPDDMLRAMPNADIAQAVMGDLNTISGRAQPVATPDTAVLPNGVQVKQFVRQVLSKEAAEIKSFTDGLDGDYAKLDASNNLGLTTGQDRSDAQREDLDTGIRWTINDKTLALIGQTMDLLQISGNTPDASNSAENISALLNIAASKYDYAERTFVVAKWQQSNPGQMPQNLTPSSDVGTALRADLRWEASISTDSSANILYARHLRKDAKQLVADADSSLEDFDVITAKAVASEPAPASPDAALVASGGSMPKILAALAAGAKIDARDAQGQTALMQAAMYEWSIDAWVLVTLGADVDLKGALGKTAEQQASGYRVIDAIESAVRARTNGAPTNHSAR